MTKSTILSSKNGKIVQKQKGRTSGCTITSKATPFEEKKKNIEFILFGKIVVSLALFYWLHIPLCVLHDAWVTLYIFLTAYKCFI